MKHVEISTEPKLRSICLEDIIRYARKIDPSIVHHSHKGCLVGLFHGTHSNMMSFNTPLRLEAFAFVLCTKGSLEFSCNLKDYKIEEGSLLLLPPKSLVVWRGSSTADQGYAVILDAHYLSECNFNIGRFTSLMMQVVEQICIRLTPSEVERLAQAITMLDSLIGEQIESPFREDVIRAMVETTMYLFCESFSAHISQKEETQISRQESYFRQFLQELNKHYTERQPVTYYAEQLCISPRYLTTIVRRYSGMTVTDWMDKYLIMEAKYLLKYSGMSIQEIAYQLSFSDQSFFGKFFRLHVGMSPTAYRNQQP